MQVFPARQSFEALDRDFPDFDADSIETCLAFLDATTEVYAALNSYFERYGLSGGKFTVLMQLYTAKQGIPPSEFAERANVTRATITGLLDGLERDGLIQRQPHPSDRRMLTVHLTERGSELMQNILPEHFCRTKILMDTLTVSEKRNLVKLLDKLRSGASALSDRAQKDLT
jgi:DNA-binding MarR family transcriptional regulator